MDDRLTRSEVVCLRLVGRELSNKAIARELGLSVKTVQNHLTSAYRKLGTSDRRAAAFLVARDYPDLSQYRPTPMAWDPGRSSDQSAPGDEVRTARDPIDRSAWILPEPPKRLLHLLGIVFGFAAVAGVITAGLVHLAAGGMTTLAARAPPDATLALDHNRSSRTP